MLVVEELLVTWSEMIMASALIALRARFLSIEALGLQLKLLEHSSFEACLPRIKVIESDFQVVVF